MSVIFFTPPEPPTKVNPISVQAAPDAAPPSPTETSQEVDALLAQLSRYRRRPWRGLKALYNRPEVRTHPEVATALVDCALVVGRIDVAEQAMQHVEDISGLIQAQYLLAKNEPEAALAALTSPQRAGLDHARANSIKIRALVLVGAYAQAVVAAHDWAKDMPNAHQPYTVLAKALAEVNNPRAADWFECALFISDGGATERLNFAQYLVEQGDTEAARAHLDSVTTPTGRMARRKARIMRRMNGS